MNRAQFEEMHILLESDQGSNKKSEINVSNEHRSMRTPLRKIVIIFLSCLVVVIMTGWAALLQYYHHQRGNHPVCEAWYCYVRDGMGYPVMGECGGVVGQTSECPLQWQSNQHSRRAQHMIEKSYDRSPAFATLADALPIRRVEKKGMCVQRVIPPGMAKINVTLRYTGEFGYDVMVVLPFAYHLHRMGDGYLKKVIGCGDISALYTPWTNKYETDHACTREYNGGLVEYGFPDQGLNTCPPPCFWTPPPLGSFYRSRKAAPFNDPNFNVGRQLVVINNKFSTEWGSAPVNFIDVPTLEALINIADRRGVTIIYNRPTGEKSFRDAEHSIQKKHDLRDRKLIHDGLDKGRWSPNTIRDFGVVRPQGVHVNIAQLELFARARCFVSVQGGNSYLPFFFGGRQLVYHTKGTENVCAYEHNFPRLGGAHIQQLPSYKKLITAFENMLESEEGCAAIEPGE